MAKTETPKADAPKMVTVEALEAHSAFGEEYEVGDTYDIDEQYVDSLAFQGKAIRVDRVAHAKAQTKAAEKSTKVEPMTTKSKGSRALAKPRKTRK